MAPLCTAACTHNCRASRCPKAAAGNQSGVLIVKRLRDLSPLCPDYAPRVVDRSGRDEAP